MPAPRSAMDRGAFIWSPRMPRTGSASTDAINNPAMRQYPQREAHNAEMPVREMAPIDDADNRASDIILSSEDQAAKGYLDALRFNEEELTIFLHRGREKFAPQILDFYVNGQIAWVPVEREVKIKRKFVEVMARAQPMDVRTESHMVENSQDANTVNRIHRSLSANYSFSVRHDPNPRGADWLAKVMRES